MLTFLYWSTLSTLCITGKPECIPSTTMVWSGTYHALLLDTLPIDTIPPIPYPLIPYHRYLPIGYPTPVPTSWISYSRNDQVIPNIHPTLSTLPSPGYPTTWKTHGHGTRDKKGTWNQRYPAPPPHPDEQNDRHL